MISHYLYQPGLHFLTISTSLRLGGLFRPPPPISLLFRALRIVLTYVLSNEQEEKGKAGHD